MDSNFIDKIPITEVWQEVDTDFFYSIQINYKISDTHFKLWVKQHPDDQKWYPTRVWHQKFSYEKCPYCSGETVECNVLTEYKEKMFEMLIEHNSIRLFWLYMDHK